MAKKNYSKPTIQSATAPTVGPAEAANRIRDQIRKGRELLNGPITSADEQAWEAVMKRVLSQAFGDHSDPLNSVMDVGKFAFAFGGGTEEQFLEQRREDMTTRLKILEGLAEALDVEGTASSSPKEMAAMPDTSRVFLVHGHEHGVVEACARMIERFGLKPIILHEQPNEGRTTIEKFEHHADAGFAVVFLTPDDVGGAKNKPQSARARQNVILELGYFVGKLGRKNVCALYREGVELPSDYHGVQYVSLDREDWKMKVAQEMRAAKLDVDLNHVAE